MKLREQSQRRAESFAAQEHCAVKESLLFIAGLLVDSEPSNNCTDTQQRRLPATSVFESYCTSEQQSITTVLCNI